MMLEFAWTERQWERACEALGGCGQVAEVVRDPKSSKSPWEIKCMQLVLGNGASMTIEINEAEAIRLLKQAEKWYAERVSGLVKLIAELEGTDKDTE